MIENKIDWEKYKAERKIMFSKKTDQELINSYNKEAGCNSWTTGRMYHLNAMRTEMKKRKWDLSAIVEYSSSGEIRAMFFKNKIKLIENKIVLSSVTSI